MADKKKAKKQQKKSRIYAWFNEEQLKLIDRLVGTTLGDDRAEVVKQITLNYIREKFHADSDFKG